MNWTVNKVQTLLLFIAVCCALGVLGIILYIKLILDDMNAFLQNEDEVQENDVW